MANRFKFKAKLLLAFAGTTVVGVLIAAGTGGVAQAQPQSPNLSKRLTFEVASIKQSQSSNDGTSIQTAPGGGFRAHGITLRELILNAYDLHDFQLSGGPDWTGSTKFDIAAKADNDDSVNPATEGAAHRRRLQSLLADRFNLKLHTNKKELPIYALVVMRDGPKLQSATNFGSGPSMTMRRGQLIADGISMDLFAANLSNLLDRIVQDRTGLAGSYSLKLEWTPEQAALPPGSENNAAPGDTAGPSLFTALQEQLGLKLEPQKGQVILFVVDHVQRPSEN